MKLDELAKLAGVSRTTASYVVNGKAKQYRVSDSTIHRVQQLIEQYDFKPNAMAAGLRAGRTKTIGLIIPDFENQSYAKITNRLENRCRELGYQLLITCSNDNQENEIECAKHLFQRKIDALIVSTTLSMDNRFYQENSQIPIFGFDRCIRDEHVMNVLTDDENDAYRLAQGLIRKPCSQILFLGALPELATSIEREKGFKRALNGTLSQVNYLYADKFNQDSAAEIFSAWLKEHPLPQGIFITSLTLLQGVLKVLFSNQQKIPKDLLIATFGHHELLNLLENRVICCVQDHEEIAENLFHLVMATLEKKKHAFMMNAIQREIIALN